MTSASRSFRDARSVLLDRDVVVVATVGVQRNPFTDALKRRPDLRVVQVAEQRRDSLPGRQLVASCIPHLISKRQIRLAE